MDSSSLIQRDPFSLFPSKFGPMGGGGLNRWGMTPFDPTADASSLMNRMTGDLGSFGGGGLGSPFFGSIGFPANASRDMFRVLRQLGMSELLSTDVIESLNDYQVACELPGVTPNDCKIHLEGNTLTIRAERKSSFKQDSAFYHQRECMSGRVERSFTLPQDANTDQASANFDNGLLVVVFPKKKIAPEPQPNVKEIKIQSS